MFLLSIALLTRKRRHSAGGDKGTSMYSLMDLLVAIQQAGDQGEQNTHGYPAHQHSGDALQRP